EGEVNEHLISVLGGIAADDMASAVKRFEAIPDEKQRSDSAMKFFWSVYSQPLGVERLLAELKDPALRTRVVAGSVSTLAYEDGGRAARLLAADPGAQELSDGKEVYWRYYLHHPAEAMASLDELPAGKMRNQAVFGIASYIAGQDPAGCYALFEKFPDAATNRAVIELAWRIFDRDDRKALGLVYLIPEEAVRHDLLFQLLQHQKDWTTDPNAKRWLENNKIPSEVRDRLQKKDEAEQTDEP
ncbi:MAG TPA: hypothetical protein VGE67_02095, partial [Haloferula sp.]